jgi:hypothetical protein
LTEEYWLIIASKDPGFKPPSKKLVRILDKLRELGVITENESDLPEGEIRPGTWADPGTPIPFIDMDEAKKLVECMGVDEFFLKFERTRADFESRMVIRKHQHSLQCTYGGTYIFVGEVSGYPFENKIGQNFTIGIQLYNCDIDSEYVEEINGDPVISEMLLELENILGVGVVLYVITIE